MKKLLPFSFIVLSAALTTPLASEAQIVNCNAFLKGNYVEVGISPSGTFGSSADQPTGYHGNSTGYGIYNPCAATVTGFQLGFVADPAMDGWTVGTPPFWGDYFLPGTPYEGYSLQINGVRADAFNPNDSGFTSGMTGTTISDTLIGGTTTAIWQGMFDSVRVTQTVTLDTGSLYFRLDINLTNTAATPRDNIYYMRSVDPDNDEMEPGGGFPTNNMIRDQNPASGNSLVVATGVIHPQAYLGIGSADSNSRVMIFDSWPLASTTDISTIYNGTVTGGSYFFTAGDSLGDQDIAIGIIFSIPHLAPADSSVDSVYDRTTATGLHPANSRTMTLYYAFSSAAADSAVAAITGTHSSTAVSKVSGNMLKLFPNPARNSLTLTGVAGNLQTSVIDMMGRTWNTQNFINPGSQVSLDISGLAIGHYLLIVRDENGTVAARIPFVKI